MITIDHPHDNIATAFTLANFDPAGLSYVAALRGVAPRQVGQSFAYVMVGCRDIPVLLCTAASNPEGKFWCVFGDTANDKATVDGAGKLATARAVTNIQFINVDIATATADQLPNLLAQLPPVDYLVCDASAYPLTVAARAGLFAFASVKLSNNGLFTFRYKAWREEADIIRFLVSEYSPRMDQAQSLEFLEEIQKLGGKFLSTHPDEAVELAKAIEKANPDFFMDIFNAKENEVYSGTVETMGALIAKGFTLLGDAVVAANYMELATPIEAHPVLLQCREHVFYEPIKDFAMQRLIRNDVWCRKDIAKTDNLTRLFGDFTYGLAAVGSRLPQMFRSGNITVHLSSAPYAGLLEMMDMMPITLSHYMEHGKNKGTETQADVIVAINAMTAVGIVRPMRSMYQGRKGNIDHPVWSEVYNSYINNERLDTPRVLMASSVVGGGLSVSLRDALIMQAINRRGLEDAASALLPELQRLTGHLALYSLITDVLEPNQETSDNMISAAIQHSIPRWCAYGLLAA